MAVTILSRTLTDLSLKFARCFFTPTKVSVDKSLKSRFFTNGYCLTIDFSHKCESFARISRAAIWYFFIYLIQYNLIQYCLLTFRWKHINASYSKTTSTLNNFKTIGFSTQIQGSTPNLGVQYGHSGRGKAWSNWSPPRCVCWQATSGFDTCKYKVAENVSSCGM